ncbi:hypothetical protein M5689_018976 [Euphorbia peplus]|nr:hypothetical protein M5689_018976 [Euphorbia peplus]
MEDHPQDIKEVLEVLMKYGLKLNPEKLTFGATTGKFLGFIVSGKGVEVNPEKNQSCNGDKNSKKSARGAKAERNVDITRTIHIMLGEKVPTILQCDKKIKEL